MMTPEEARAIDRAEFEADCRAARERAYLHMEQVRFHKDERVIAWLSKDAPKGFLYQRSHRASRTVQPKPVKVPSRRTTLTFRGETLTLSQWSKATGISSHTLNWRIKNGWPVGDTLSRPAGSQRNPKPGVASNFSDTAVTDAPSLAQDFSQLEISK